MSCASAVLSAGTPAFVRISCIAIALLLAGCESTPYPAPVTESAVMPSPAGEPGASGATGPSRGVHVVQKGDTLYSIARSYGIDQKELADWNGVQDPATILIGQQLVLSAPFSIPQPELFALPPTPSVAAVVTVPDAAPAFEEKPGINTDRLKVEPKALKLPYSEQAMAQIQGVAPVPAIGLPREAPMAEKGVLQPGSTATAPSGAPETAVGGRDHVDWGWPTAGRVIEKFSEGTKGIDIAGNAGQSVTASAAGKVVYSGAGLRGYGKLIIVKHNNTYLSAYAHNDKILVKEGQSVAKGQKIAEMGRTDASTVKLHFEIRKNGKPVDPLQYLPEAPG
ncbi:peptidoglycan DD-metalloendopeptidase family protein [Nitrosovibrio sp. Nv17]|jgi:lipoprotein NlpD|uniref:peptidoglycan DD-metalloendopeptidase family protein n=1 Tax=Nitrosovibrio sp. Nv17 TaxID=1855339 RepID=UPI0009086C9F|nr:peptidoglycan DD-metalloendopeptidase family protein [Nitrosovibrio sp. Nv17]SFW10813.1 lipoprotein NlpD [Nitrosovibrio sp. Nv17]